MPRVYNHDCSDNGSQISNLNCAAKASFTKCSPQPLSCLLPPHFPNPLVFCFCFFTALLTVLSASPPTPTHTLPPYTHTHTYTPTETNALTNTPLCTHLHPTHAHKTNAFCTYKFNQIKIREKNNCVKIRLKSTTTAAAQNAKNSILFNNCHAHSYFIDNESGI